MGKGEIAHNKQFLLFPTVFYIPLKNIISRKMKQAEPVYLDWTLEHDVAGLIPDSTIILSEDR